MGSQDCDLNIFEPSRSHRRKVNKSQPRSPSVSPIPVHCLEQLEVDQCKGEASPGPAANSLSASRSCPEQATKIDSLCETSAIAWSWKIWLPKGASVSLVLYTAWYFYYILLLYNILLYYCAILFHAHTSSQPHVLFCYMRHVSCAAELGLSSLSKPSQSESCGSWGKVGWHAMVKQRHRRHLITGIICSRIITILGMKPQSVSSAACLKIRSSDRLFDWQIIADWWVPCVCVYIYI